MKTLQDIRTVAKEIDDAATDKRLIGVARTSPEATRLLLQLEATTIGQDSDLSILFDNELSSFFDTEPNRIVPNSADGESPYSLVSLLGQEATHALHREPIEALQSAVGDPARYGESINGRLQIEAAGSLVEGAAARELIQAAGWRRFRAWYRR